VALEPHRVGSIGVLGIIFDLRRVSVEFRQFMNIGNAQRKSYQNLPRKPLKISRNPAVLGPSSFARINHRIAPIVRL
jgi:hypothetical protein